MEFPESLLAVVKRAVKKYPADIEKCVAEAEKALRKRKAFTEWLDILITQGVQEIVYDIRHQINTRIKNENKEYGGKSTVIPGASEAVQEVESVYAYRIAGTMLGLVLGVQLLDIANSEAAIANGHQFNSVLARSLMPLVPNDKRVQEAVSEKRLQKMFREAQGGKS